MKRTVELSVVLLGLVLFTFDSASQVNDQSAQPTSPNDRVSPTGELNGKANQQPIMLKVVGASLRDNDGASIGRVEDLIVDPVSGRIEFLIVSAFFPTNSTKLMPIPWKAITYRSEQTGNMPGPYQVFALNFPRTKLRQAPAFERYRWPDMSQSAWRQPVYEFYADARAAGAGGSETETQVGVGTGVGPNTSTGPLADPNVSAGVARTNSTLSTNAPTRPFIGPVINSTPGARTNLPADLRNQSSTPDNRLPIGARR